MLGAVGNASSLHTSGRTARRRIEESRELIAAKLGARPSEVIFTAGGTESDNLAVKGIYWARRDAEPRHRRIVTTRGGTPRGAGLGALARRTRRRAGDLAAHRRRRLGVGCRAARGAAEPRRRRAGIGDVGEQRGRHRHAGRRTRRRRRRIRRPDAQRRDSGGGAAARRLHRQRALGDERHRAQVRRSTGGRCVAAAPRRRAACRYPTAAGRSATFVPAHPMSPAPSEWRRRPASRWTDWRPTARGCGRCAIA